NVKPKNYSWTDFYDQVISLTKYTFSRGAILNRFRATRAMIPRWMNVIRAVSSEGFGRIKYYSEVRRRLETDFQLRRYFEGETTDVRQFFAARVRQDLGPLWQWLPSGAMYYDPNAYRASENEKAPARLTVAGPSA